MRWSYKEKPSRKEGTTRIITRFLLFPRQINQQWRWLEIAKIEQTYHNAYFTDNCDLISSWWEDTHWIN
jgi:hypothetical protein